jgi:putative membrane protein
VLQHLPDIEAFLNGIVLVTLGVGFAAIRRRNVARHRALMVTSFSIAALFFVLYIVHHAFVDERVYRGTGWVRSAYLVLLVTHIVTSTIVPPLAIWALVRIKRGQLAAHARLARVLFPIWVYSAATGLVVNGILYQAGPPPGASAATAQAGAASAALPTE